MIMYVTKNHLHSRGGGGGSGSCSRAKIGDKVWKTNITSCCICNVKILRDDGHRYIWATFGTRSTASKKRCLISELVRGIESCRFWAGSIISKQIKKREATSHTCLNWVITLLLLFLDKSKAVVTDYLSVSN